MNKVNKKSDNWQEVIIIDSDEEPEKKRNHNDKNKVEYKRFKKSIHKKKDKLKIIQNVELNKNESSYFMNINANTNDEQRICYKKQCSSKNKDENRNHQKINHEDVEKSKDRPVPSCLRRHCNINLKTCINICSEKTQIKKKINNVHYSSKEKYKKLKCKHRKKKLSNNLPYLSPMLSHISSFMDEISNTEDDSAKSPISYDDISSESEPYTCSKLDMLIMRTKERERKVQGNLTKLQQATKQFSKHLETQDECISISSVTTDLSIQSKETRVLKRYDNKCYFNNIDYTKKSDKTDISPYIDNKLVKCRKIETNILECKKIVSGGDKYLKVEPVVKSGKDNTETYSPKDFLNFPDKNIREEHKSSAYLNKYQKTKKYKLKSNNNISKLKLNMNPTEHCEKNNQTQNKYTNDYSYNFKLSKSTNASNTVNYNDPTYYSSNFQSGYNYSATFSIISDNKPNTQNYNVPYYHTENCNNETNSFMTNYSYLNNNNIIYNSENNLATNVNCLATNNNYNAYNNYPIEDQNTLSSDVNYNNSRIISNYTESNTSLYIHNSVRRDIYVLDNFQNNYPHHQ